MNFLNKGLAQIGDLFRSMTPGARLTAGLLLVVIVVSVAYLFNHQFATGDAYLFGGEPIPPTQLPAMLASFAKAGLPEPEMEGNRMKVARGKQPAYIAAAADGGALPHNFGDTFKKMVENNNPFISKQQRADMAKFALQDELTKIISRMNGIETASVLYDEQNQTGLNAKRLVSASVSVKPIGMQPLTSTQVQMIRQLVAGAKVGLAAESVSVVDLNGRAFPGGSPDSSGDVSQDKYLNTKQSYEQGYTDRISQALSFVKGAVISVNVELNPVLDETENNNKIDPKAIVLDSTETNKTLNSSSAQPGGRPGAANQGANAPAIIGSGLNGTRMEEESGSTRQRSVASNQSTIIRRAGLTPKRVRVAIGVPTNYFEDIWRQRNPSPAGSEPKKPDAAAIAQIETEERAKIQQYVLPIIGTADVAAELENVVVKPFQSMPVAAIEKPTPVDHAVSWFTDHASNVGLGVFGLFSLLMVRSIVRSVPTPAPVESPQRETAAAAQPADEEETEAEATQPASASRLRRRRSKTGPSLRDELVEIVREDPDAAANILRSWIGSSN